MMFAESLPPPTSYQAIGWIAVSAWAIAGGVNQILKLVDRVKGKSPSPPNEQLEVGRRELERRISAVEKEQAESRKESQHEKEQGESTARASRAALYKKVDDVRAELVTKVDDLRDEMTSQFKDTERALGRIEGKLDK